MPPAWVLVLLSPRGRASHRLVRGWWGLVIRASGCRVRMTGVDRLRGAGTVVLVSNHISYIDSVVFLAVVPVDFRFVAEHGVLTWPLVGTGVRKAGHLTVNRGSRAARLACAGTMVDTLRAGGSLLVYPEGRRSRGEGLLPFRLGAFRAAVDAGRPVVPIATRGTATIVATEHRWVRRAPPALTVHPALAPLGPHPAETLLIPHR